MPAAGVFRHCNDHHSCIPHNGKTVGNHGGGTELCTFLLYFVCFIYNDSNFCDSEKEKRNCKRNLIFFHKKVPEPGLYLAGFRYLFLSFLFNRNLAGLLYLSTGNGNGCFSSFLGCDHTFFAYRCYLFIGGRVFHCGLVRYRADHRL